MARELPPIELPIPADDLDRRFLTETNLAIPSFDYDPYNPQRRLLFHFSPVSKTAQRANDAIRPASSLVPRRRLVSGYIEGRVVRHFSWQTDLPESADVQYSFFFLDSPFPKNWTDLYPGYFEFCMAFVRKGQNEPLDIFALETNDTDQVYVAERYLKAQHDWSRRTSVRDFDAALAYLDSLVPLSQYQDDYLLPEAVIAHPIDSYRLMHVGQATIPELPYSTRYWLEPRRSDRDAGRF